MEKTIEEFLKEIEMLETKISLAVEEFISLNRNMNVEINVEKINIEKLEDGRTIYSKPSVKVYMKL